MKKSIILPLFIIVFTTLNAQSWVVETVASMGQGTFIGAYSNMAIGTDNVIHISHHDFINANLLYTTNISGQWVTEVVDSSGHVGAYCAIALDANNHPHISYFYHVSNDTLFWPNDTIVIPYGHLKYANKTGTQWQTSILDTASGMVPRICIDNINNIHIVHTQLGINDLPNLANTRYTTNASGTWVNEPIAAGIVRGADASIAADSDNHIHIAVHNQQGGGSSGGLRYVTNITGTWAWHDIDTNFLAGNDTDIFIDKDNNIHICYLDKSLGLKYATNSSGNWQYIVVDTSYNVGWNGSIAVDTNNFVHISYSDPIYRTTTPGNGYLKYANNLNNNWSIAILDSNYAGMYTSIALDTNYLPHIAYTFCDSANHTDILKHAYIPLTSVSTLYTEKKDMVFSIYPNPTSEYFKVYIADDESLEDSYIFIYDVVGREVMRMPVTQRTTRVETSTWQKGVYILNLINNNAVISRKLIKN